MNFSQMITKKDMKEILQSLKGMKVVNKLEMSFEK